MAEETSAALNNFRAVGLDTMAFIYFFERHPRYLPLVRPIFERAEAGKLRLVVSFVVPLEVKVGFKKDNNVDAELGFAAMLRAFPTLTVVHSDDAIIEAAAYLRAAYNLAVADALNVATAVEAGADAFLTNDRALTRVREIPVLTFDTLK